jgi:MFS transporter, DHA1 family, multidrug resistance protein
MSDRLLRPALVLGLLSAIGPFAIDLYLPAMPLIGADLGTSVQAMQSTITAYFIAFGLAQLIYGPWADRSGRKPPLYAGIGVFVVGSVICTFAPSVEWLLAGRFVQGLGGAALMVVPRAIIRDLYTGHQATRLMAAVMLVISVSPMLAPLAGSGLMAVFDWRAIFAALLIASCASLAILALFQPETLRPEDRQPFNLAAMVSGTRVLLTDPLFMGLTFLGGFGLASFFVFIASAKLCLHRRFRPVAHRILGGFCDQCHRLLCFVADGSLAWPEVRAAAGDGGGVGGVRRCDGRALRAGAGGAGQPAGLRGGTVSGQRLPWPGHSNRDGDGAG